MWCLLRLGYGSAARACAESRFPYTLKRQRAARVLGLGSASETIQAPRILIVNAETPAAAVYGVLRLDPPEREALALSGPEGRRDRQPGSAERGQEAAGDPDAESPREAPSEERPGHAELECDLRERVEVQRGEGEPVAIDVRERAAHDPAEERQDQSLDHHGCHHGQATEADRSQRGDLDL